MHKKHITRTLFSKLIAGLILGLYLVFTTGCGKFLVLCSVIDKKRSKNPRCLSDLASLCILDCIHLVKPPADSLVLHEFFKNINAYESRLRTLHNLVPSYITENSHITLLDHFINKHSTSLDRLDSDGFTPLHWAVLKLNEKDKDEMRLFKALLYQDHVNTKNIYGTTALHLASRLGRSEMVSLLVDHENIDINVKNKYDSTPLHFAAEEGHEKVVKLLANSKDIIPDVTDKNGKTPIELAKTPKIAAILKEAKTNRSNRKRKL